MVAGAGRLLMRSIPVAEVEEACHHFAEEALEVQKRRAFLQMVEALPTCLLTLVGRLPALWEVEEVAAGQQYSDSLLCYVRWVAGRWRTCLHLRGVVELGTSAVVAMAPVVGLVKGWVVGRHLLSSSTAVVLEEALSRSSSCLCSAD